jgi:hypothetical protein
MLSTTATATTIAPSSGGCSGAAGVSVAEAVRGLARLIRPFRLPQRCLLQHPSAAPGTSPSGTNAYPSSSSDTSVELASAMRKHDSSSSALPHHMSHRHDGTPPPPADAAAPHHSAPTLHGAGSYCLGDSPQRQQQRWGMEDHWWGEQVSGGDAAWGTQDDETTAYYNTDANAAVSTAGGMMTEGIDGFSGGDGGGNSGCNTRDGGCGDPQPQRRHCGSTKQPSAVRPLVLVQAETETPSSSTAAAAASVAIAAPARSGGRSGAEHSKNRGAEAGGNALANSSSSSSSSSSINSSSSSSNSSAGSSKQCVAGSRRTKRPRSPPAASRPCGQRGVDAAVPMISRCCAALDWTRVHSAALHHGEST